MNFIRLLKRIGAEISRVSAPVGRFLTAVLLTAVYYFILSPLALVRRISRGGALDLDFPAGEGKSFWKRLPGRPLEPADLEDQF
jgi:hypothetical protein